MKDFFDFAKWTMTFCLGVVALMVVQHYVGVVKDITCQVEVQR